jgi:hypothetical protein
MTTARTAPDLVPRQRDAATHRGALRTTDGHDRRDYRRWSVEELRAFASQLQLPNASAKSRSELLDIFGVSTDV